MLFGEMLEKDPEKYKQIKERNRRKKAPTYSYLGTTIPQDILENFNWNVERDIYKRLCRGEKLPKVKIKIYYYFSLCWSKHGKKPLSIGFYYFSSRKCFH